MWYTSPNRVIHGCVVSHQCIVLLRESKVHQLEITDFRLTIIGQFWSIKESLTAVYNQIKAKQYDFHDEHLQPSISNKGSQFLISCVQ